MSHCSRSSDPSVALELSFERLRLTQQAMHEGELAQHDVLRSLGAEYVALNSLFGDSPWIMQSSRIWLGWFNQRHAFQEIRPLPLYGTFEGVTQLTLAGEP
ncbi:MAG: hypothetical protein WBP26_02925 [Candidatus Saccharimonadales bacterium]